MIRLSVTIFGRFSIRDASGRSLAPKSAKSQGLLALLLTSPDGVRNRTWLQDKLWSDRGKTQGSGSLRQALVEIRRAFGTEDDLIFADRQVVGIDLSRIAIQARQENQEFLEGLDVRDQEFEAWLTVERARHHTPKVVVPSPAAGRVILIEGAHADADELADLEAGTADAVARSLREFSNVRVFLEAASAAGRPLFRLSIRATRVKSGELRLRTVLTDTVNGELIWSETVPLLGTDGDKVDRAALANRALGAILDNNLRRDDYKQGSAGDVVDRAIRRILSMREVCLDEADHHLRIACEEDRRGIYKALQAQVYATQYVEQSGGDPALLPEMAEESIALALECEPDNSLVLAIASNVHRIFGRNFEGSGELGRMAVRANPANPLAWLFLSAAWLYKGDHAAAASTATASQKMAEGSRFKFWADFQAALVAMMSDDKSRAVRLLERSHALAPSFRPPMRYLIALYAGSGRTEQAKIVARRLRRVERGFTTERLALDATYPVSLLRGSAYLDPRRIMEINPEA